jgi:hypothetical protein
MSSELNDFEKLEPVRELLLQMCDEPEVAIPTELTRILCSQISGTRLLSLTVSSVPEVLCTGQEDDHGLLSISRFGIAIPFHANTCAPGHPTTLLTGVFTWTITDVEKPEVVKSRFWLDVNGDLANFGKEGELLSRLYRFPCASQASN